MRRKLVAGNWKMNGSLTLARKTLETLQPLPSQSGAEILLCPPFTLLSGMVDIFQHTGIAQGAQNVHPQPGGAFTGEVSVSMLVELGVKWCIVGHSERRTHFNESDEWVREKTEALLQQGIHPIICIGETLEQREAGIHEEIVIGQLRKGVSGLSASQKQQCVIAYEPVWAIGTGRTATPEQANEMHGLIREELQNLSAEGTASDMRILYGGSVNAGNAESLLRQSDIDGALVGGASLKPEEFLKIVAVCD